MYSKFEEYDCAFRKSIKNFFCKIFASICEEIKKLWCMIVVQTERVLVGKKQKNMKCKAQNIVFRALQTLPFEIRSQVMTHSLETKVALKTNCNTSVNFQSL